MAENVITGFIINISDYEIYDQILTLLLPNNLKLTLIALGTKKILSKNARNISLLNQVEAEVFLARNINKISKLKKIISLYNFS
ncbi:recombination protein O N-terminal domain-containing protein [bacterium]|jgi:DNA repair protein RecO (recombination protein O)|nr:recombination protein O N-terminal domain-containing protein [bacterium]MBO6022481.1 recombination protein O N-terminal domain-containing protein [bacterium]MBO6041900.1 recombination protein O N-terminal domain-containing protein [bacterium]MBO6072642.1 recombination protein O N-terminal domain-containing protein [bacterium]MBO7044306.1 recombination protein O N-terminal domain-containing protein [bacterium]